MESQLKIVPGGLECPPFGDYTADPNSILMTLTI
jgi:hypothetical protein